MIAETVDPWYIKEGELVEFKPYYQDDSCVIINGDCADVMPHLKQFGLVLTDPPYGLGDRMKGGTWGGCAKYDKMRTWDQETPAQEVMDLVLSMSDQHIIWGGNYFSLPPMRCWLVWDKNAVPTMASAELAWTSLDKPVRTYRGRPGVHTHNHPTQKPEPLFRWCLEFVPEATTILDPFMGVGTTLVAAKREGRLAVGIELDERYCESAAKRLEQGMLF